MAPRKATGKPALRWWQRLCRLAVGLLLLLAAAYAALPYWAPTGLLCRRLAADLAAQTGVAVHVEGMTLGWADGIELRGLTIASPEGFGDAPAVRVERVRTELAPIDLLARGRLGHLELISPRVNVRIDAEGAVNLAPLARLEGGPDVGRVSVRDGVVVLRVAASPKTVNLRVASFQLDTSGLRQMSMSAALVQDGNVPEAPVSLSPRAVQGAEAASASLTFRNVDLAQLPLAELAGLDVRKLSGLADGALDLSVRADGVVESFRAGVSARKLEVQPADPNVRLPALDAARVSVAARYDSLTRALELESFALRLPGADLTGEAEVFSEALAGHWEAVERLQLRGEIDPARLASLLTGADELPGGLAVRGPVGVGVDARREGTRLRLRLEADATAAALSRAGRQLKPPGRELRMGLAGELDHRTSKLTAEESFLRLAGNRFTGHGALRSLRRLARRLGRQTRPLGGALLAELTGLDWRGEWEITDLPPLLAAMGDAAARPPWADLRLDGELTGRWFLHHGSTTRVHVTFHAPPATRLAVGEAFVKPPDTPLDLDVNLAVAPNEPGLRDLGVVLTAGAGRLALEQADVMPAGTDGTPPRARGRFSVEDLPALLACLPAAANLDGRVAGGLSGQFDVVADGRLHSLRLAADLKPADLRLGPWWVKPPGRAGELRLRAACPRADGPAEFSAVWETPRGQVDARGVLPAGLPATARQWRALLAGRRAGPEGTVARLSAEADVTDASWLAAASPALADALGGARLGGGARITATGTVRPDAADANCFLDATALTCAVDAPVARAKAAGTPCTLALVGRIQRRDGELDLHLRRAEAALGDARASLTGQARLADEAHAATQPAALAGPLRAIEARIDVAAGPDEALAALLPELRRLRDRHGLSGRVRLGGALRGADGRWRADLLLDANELAAANLLPPADAAEPNAPPARLGPVVKPADVPARLAVNASAPADLSRLDVSQAELLAGDLRVGLSGSARLVRDGNALAVQPGEGSLRVTASTKRARTLERLLPRLAPLKLRGAAAVTAELIDANGPAVASASAALEGMVVRLRGRNVHLDGELAVRGVRPRAVRLRLGPEPDDMVELPAIDHLRTDGLEVLVGGTHGWLVADVSSLPVGPEGSFQVLADRWDNAELVAWLGEKGAATRPAARTLDEDDANAVRATGRMLARLVKRLLGPAELGGRIDVRHFRTYDESVRQVYDLRRLAARLKVADGELSFRYTAGLNGGRTTSGCTVDLTRPASVAACSGGLEDVLAEDNIQPQLAKQFPGNTVYGTFSRQEETKAALSELLAGAIDPRYDVLKVGTGKTVATDGMTEGRAAPKFITNIFPGLNLAKYRYRKMTGFAEFRPDGTTANDLIFDGRVYDLYMEGTTDANNIGRYEIGLILLGQPQSAEWNHTYRQGRIPILNFKARIEGGTMHDEEVSYLWPNETLFTIFLKNNIFYRIWLAAGKNREVPPPAATQPVERRP